jgi:hypothetical protein
MPHSSTARTLTGRAGSDRSEGALGASTATAELNGGEAPALVAVSSERQSYEIAYGPVGGR